MGFQKMSWKLFILSSCFKPKKRQACMKITKKPRNCPTQRISLLDFSHPDDSEMWMSDLSNSVVGSNLLSFTRDELRSVTADFASCNYLGEGGFGAVYKGFVDERLRPGLDAQAVAVKVLDLEGSQGHQEWLAEVIFLGQLRHPHLMKLIGYCCENNERSLVYEYMERGSLDSQLFRRCSAPLPWLTRMKIAVEAAKGLAFLHEEDKPIIFRDFKAANILLDLDYTAKLSDFGFARDASEDGKSHITTKNILGTKGYVAPEYMMTGHLTTKSDVYSYGVVLLELLTGRRCMDKTRPRREQSLVDWARPYLKSSQTLHLVMDPRLEGQYSAQGAKIAAMVAYRCLSYQAKVRPTMTSVVKTLEPLLDMSDDILIPFVYIVPGETNNFVKVQPEEEVEEEIKADAPKRHGGVCRLRPASHRVVHSDSKVYSKTPTV